MADTERKTVPGEKRKGGEDFRGETPQKRAADGGRGAEGRPRRANTSGGREEGEEGLIVNRRVVLKNLKMSVGIKREKRQICE